MSLAEESWFGRHEQTLNYIETSRRKFRAVAVARLTAQTNELLLLGLSSLSCRQPAQVTTENVLKRELKLSTADTILNMSSSGIPPSQYYFPGSIATLCWSRME